MKKLIVGLLACIVVVSTSGAESTALKNGVGWGFQINQYQDDFGLGLTMTSPYVRDAFAFRLRGNLMFNENVRVNETDWDSYYNFTAGLVGVAGTVNESIRLYGEGGLIGLFPSSKFSGDAFILGGYGLFGFEFHMDARRNYFIELGGVGTDARKDKIPNRPIYSNGMLISTGFRITL
ncbi:MAG: hypothetical protein KKC51_06790 [Verrucomicrobia bacterium]|nr:hypothetical protein [Verrucomicrobiota bacterium]